MEFRPVCITSLMVWLTLTGHVAGSRHVGFHDRFRDELVRTRRACSIVCVSYRHSLSVLFLCRLRLRPSPSICLLSLILLSSAPCPPVLAVHQNQPDGTGGNGASYDGPCCRPSEVGRHHVRQDTQTGQSGAVTIGRCYDRSTSRC